MRRAFGEGGATLVLIGDPKQAIYAFRGADVYAYLEAAAAAGGGSDAATSTGAATRRCSRPTTRCSAARSSATRASSTGACAAADRRRGASAPVGAPLRVRVVRPVATVEAASKGLREHIAAASRAVVRARSSPSRPASTRRVGAGDVRPGDIAVLVRTNRNAR